MFVQGQEIIVTGASVCVCGGMAGKKRADV